MHTIMLRRSWVQLLSVWVQLVKLQPKSYHHKLIIIGLLQIIIRRPFCYTPYIYIHSWAYSKDMEKSVNKYLDKEIWEVAANDKYYSLCEWDDYRWITCRYNTSELLCRVEETQWDGLWARTMLAALDRRFYGSGCKYSIAKNKELAEPRKVIDIRHRTQRARQARTRLMQ